MALNWQWEDKVGTITECYNGRENTYHMYRANGAFVALSEWEEDGHGMYCMHAFFIDGEHTKAMLGLDADHDNVYDGYTLKVTIYADRADKSVQTWLKLLYKSNPQTVTTILPTKPAQ